MQKVDMKLPGSSYTEDKFWLPSNYEIWGNKNGCCIAEGTYYRYWSNQGSKVTLRIKQIKGKATSYWTRSTNTNSNREFSCVNSSTGSVARIPAINSGGVSPAFCL